MAAVLACGPTALLSHRTGGALLGLLGWRASWPIDVSVIRGGGRRRPGVAIHRPRRLHPGDRTQIAGIPVTSVPRTLLDLATHADGKQLAKAFEEADRNGTLSYAALTQLIERTRGHKGLKLLKRVMRAHTWPDPHTRTELEHAFARFCDDRGIPRPHFNVQIGPYTVDALWPAWKLIVELDGREGHGWLAAKERDHVRDADLQLQGYLVIRVSWRRLHHEPDEVAARIRRAAQRRPLATAI
jgi:very-short-patch-repair endonuclease